MSSAALSGFRMVVMSACHQILGRQRVERQWEKNSCSQFSIDAPQLMTNSRAMRSGPCAFPLLIFLRAAVISSLVKSLNSVLFSLSTFFLRSSIFAFTSDLAIGVGVPVLLYQLACDSVNIH